MILSAKTHVNALCYLPHKLIPTSLFFFFHFDLHLIFISPTFFLPLPALSGARGYDGALWGLLSRQPCQRDGGDARISAHTRNIHAFLWWPVWYWGSSSFIYLFFFFSIFAAFIPRRFGKRVQDVRVVEAPVEVSLCRLTRLRTFGHFVCVHRPGYVFIKGIYRAGLAPASEARLFLPGFLLLEVVSSPLATVISCHFLRFWKETLACFLTRPVSCFTELVRCSFASSL